MKELYQTATELYTSSLRALEQRAMAFLIVQSLLVTSYATLFSKYNGENSAIPHLVLYGVALLGIAFCILFYVAGRTVSQDTWLWRKRMQSLEKGTTDKLWSEFCEDGKKRFWLQKHCMDRLPAPTLWIISPALFFAIWICALLIIYDINWWWFIIAILPIVVGTSIIYCRHTKYDGEAKIEDHKDAYTT